MSTNSTDVSIRLQTSFQQATTQAKAMNRQMGDLTKTLERVTGLTTSFNSNTKKMSGSSLRSTKKSVDETSTSYEKLVRNQNRFLNGLNRGLNLGKLYFLWNRLKPLMSGIGSILESSVDYTETVNLFNNAMGDMADTAMEFQNKIQFAFGLGATSAMKYQATFKNMLSSLGGLSNETAEQLSETISLMALDYSSLYNVDMDSSASKFQAALSKQVKPIRSTSGYDITQDVLGASLQQMGIYDRMVSDLSEMEQRLVIIYTLQQQMANSNAFGDMARTIEQPANQLRVLKEQLAEVKRWIGNVFYGTLAAVLPYINGFVMAVKEAVKWLALLIGYKVEDSSGGNTYFDQAFGSDAIEGSSDAIGDVNKGLDDTKKKLKEIKNATGSIDELNVIQMPEDNDTGSSGSGGSGGSGGGVDPRILEAIGQYDDLFDSIRMKAYDIRDAILEWGKDAGKWINDNIFKPIKNSWDKYGAGIVREFSSGFSNLGTLVGSIADSIGKNFGSTFQALSDLFFSLLETAGIVFNGVTGFLLIVWENGGKYLFEQVSRLGVAFIELATSINDNFVKPLLRWLNANIMPVLGKVLGALLGFIGSIVGGLADFIKWLAKNTTAVKALGIVITTLATSFAAAKIINRISDFSKLFKEVTAGKTVFQKLNVFLLENNKIYTSLAGNWSKFTRIMSQANSALSPLGSIFTNLGSRIVKTEDGVKAITGSISSLSTAQSLAQKATQLLGSALMWLGANPLVAVVAGIGLLVGALVLFSSSQDDSTEKTKKKIKEIEKEIEESKKLTEEIKAIGDAQRQANEQAETSAKEASGNYELIYKYMEELNSITGEGGYASNISKAQEYVERINDILPDTVALTEDGRIVWQKTNDEVKEQIDLLIQKARITAYEDAYVKAIDNQAKATDSLNEATKKHNDALNEKNEWMKRWTDEGFSAERAQEEWNKAIENGEENVVAMDKAIKQSNEELKESKKTFAEGEDAIENFNASLIDSTDSIKDQGIAAAQLQMGYDGLLGKNGELTRSYSDLRSSYDYYSKQMETGSETEKKIAKEAKDYVLSQLAEKAKVSGLTYEEMVKKAKEENINLTEEDKKALKEMYDNQVTAYDDEKTLFDQQNTKLMKLLKDNNIDINSEMGKEYKRRIENAQKNGTESGQKELEAIQKEFAGGKSKEQLIAEANKTGISVKDTFESIKSIMKVGTKKDGSEVTTKNSLNDTFSKLNPKVKIGTYLDFSSIESTKNSVKNAFSDIKFALKGGSGGSMTLSAYAAGGFPTPGELFIANEAGPELIGTMNGRTAVANNDQITAGIKSALVEAIAPLMANVGGSEGTIIHSVTNLDGRVLYESWENQSNNKGYSFTKKK